MWILVAGICTVFGAGLVFWINQTKAHIRTLETARIESTIALKACQARSLNLTRDMKNDAEIDRLKNLSGAASEWVLPVPAPAN